MALVFVHVALQQQKFHVYRVLGKGIFYKRVRTLLSKTGGQQFYGGRSGNGEVLHVLRKDCGIVAGHCGKNVADDGRRHPAAGILTETQGGADKRQDYQGNNLFHRPRS